MLNCHRTACALAVLALSLIACSEKASAAILVFTDPLTYQADVFTDDTIAFDALISNPSTYGFFGSPGTLNVGGVTFTTASPSGLYVIGAGFASSYNIPGDGTATLVIQSVNAAVNAALPTNEAAGVTTVGTNIADLTHAGPITATITFTHGGTYQYVYTAPIADTSGLGFLGFASTGDTIASVSYSDGTTNNTEFLSLDNFTYGLLNPVDAPEPTSLSLVALGAAALFFVRRRMALR